MILNAPGRDFERGSFQRGLAVYRVLTFGFGVFRPQANADWHADYTFYN